MPLILFVMPRPGHCPSCDVLFDAAERTPMVSVVCGHSLCKPCATLPTPPAHSSDSDDTSGSDDADRDTPCCPVCSVPLAGFVKNFEALAALESTVSVTDAHPSAPDLTAVVTGDLVIDRVNIHFVRAPSHELGKGGSSVVYKGVYNNGPVAVKCIRTMSDSFATEDRLRRELRNASRLRNPHIVEFRGAAWDYEDGPSSPRNVLLVTELMAGGNLRESLNSLRKDSGLVIESFVTIALQVARGIEYLHAEGLAHRDVKSANILLTEHLPKNSNRFSPNVRAKIADFGLSKYIDKATGGGTVMQSIMEPGRLEATYAYLAPEAFGGDKANVIRRDDSDDEDNGRYDEMAKKRDIYALGVLFWEMLTGKIPWAGVSLPDVYVRVCVRSDRPAPALDDSAVDRTFHRLIDRCWAQNPQRRPSARSIVAKLEKLATRYHVADPDAAAAVESVSVVSGQAPRTNVTSGTPEVPSDSNRGDLENHRDVNVGPEPLMVYHKMPSASTVHTTPNDDSKTHSNGPDPSDGAVVVGDIPYQYEDLVGADDGDTNSKPAHRQSRDHVITPASTAVQPHVQDHIETAETLLNRRSVRTRPAGSDNGGAGATNIPSDGALTRVASHGVPTHGHSASGGAATNTHGNKSSATAVAATAAAIAAAKDRERKRDDLRHGRGAPTTAAARVARGANIGAGNTGGAAGETSFQSLTGVTDVGNRNGGKEKNERAVVYDNSDEEARDFDPDRAAADEALAEWNSLCLGTPQPPRVATPVTRVTGMQQTQRSTSLGRVTGRPKSPVVRRPMSPAVGRPFTPTTAGARGAGSGEEDVRATHSLSRSTDAANGVPVPHRSPSANRGRLGRTLSASAPGNNAVRAAVPHTTTGNGMVGSTGQTVVSPSSNLISGGTGPGYGSTGTAVTPTGTVSGLVTSNSTTDTNGRRAFIRRMRSNETSRRMARSSSSTGVEHKRGKYSGTLSAATVVTTKSTPTHVSETMGSEEDLDEETSGLPKVTQVSGKENFIAMVDSVDKNDLLRLLGQRMQPLRLAALAHAALLSARHRNDEEVLRNCCAYLHRLTVPSSSSSSAGAKGGKNQGGIGHEVSEKEQMSIWKYLKARQGVEALLQALHPPEVRHPTTLCYGLLALGNLTAWDQEAHKQFRNSHGVVQVTQVMKVHSENNGVQEKGCYALACVGGHYPPKSKVIFEQSGALDVVIRALSDIEGDGGNDAVIKQACAALGAMCSLCPANALYAGRKDALTYLVTSFERFQKVSKGQGGGKRSEMRLVCKAFLDLLCHPENRKVAGAKGGSTMIIGAMQIFRLESEFVQKGLMTLAQFCALRSNGIQIVQAGGIDDIVAAMDRFQMSIALQREGCRVLTFLIKATGDQARRRLVHVGGAETLVYALERLGAIPDSNADFVIEACRALDMLFRMDNSSEGDILGRRMRKIRCDKAIKTAMMTHRQQNDIQEMAKDALRHLSALRGGGLWSRMRNGSKKW